MDTVSKEEKQRDIINIIPVATVTARFFGALECR
jgi:hypothetical protein